MRRTLPIILLFIACVCAPAFAEQGRVLGARLWQGPEGTRLVLDVSKQLSHNVFTLDNPSRVVIDLQDVRLSTDISGINVAGSPIKALRAGLRGSRDLRIVLDVEGNVSANALLLKPNREYGYRVVVDLDSGSRAVSPPPARVVKQVPSDRRDIVIAVDAGHGGEDPGARGKRGTREKDVVLEIARRLARYINEEQGMRAVLVRDGDYYIGLRKRMNKARQAQADMFVSIHADAFRDPRAQGSSVFTLSARGATSEAARWLADRENASDLVGGVSLDDKDDMLASVLLDLAQTASKDASARVAQHVLYSLKRVGHVHSSSVQQAGFAVLKSPDVPSILVETAFISNPAEEAKLRNSRHQDAIARAVFDGIKTYFERFPPAGSLMAASRRHVIERGETLSDIAKRYQVNIQQLRMVNNIRGDQIFPGQILRIPGES